MEECLVEFGRVFAYSGCHGTLGGMSQSWSSMVRLASVLSRYTDDTKMKLAKVSELEAGTF